MKAACPQNGQAAFFLNLIARAFPGFAGPSNSIFLVEGPPLTAGLSERI
jgi:hypothetical protein